MTAIDELVATLNAHAGLAALVGTRIYPVTLREDSDKPALIYTIVSTNQTATIRDTDGTINQRVQFGAFAETYEAAHNVLDQVRDCMATAANFSAVFLNELDDYDPRVRLYYAYGDYSIWY